MLSHQLAICVDVIIRRLRGLVVGVEYFLTQLLVWDFCFLVGGRGVVVTVGGVTGFLKQQCVPFFVACPQVSP
jgi:hypothetical protein